ncbi:GUN4 domain protein [Calothrix sp. NIES-4071]|nr:GUN4 domain protein [Calothrix sp. NIES-4071]BAZ63768.1 GUN4 domain protein [Calothrix sp. NIES-4105]
MANNRNEPREFDAVRGGEAPPPVQGAVLGGIQGVKQRLASSEEETRIGALSSALNYGNTGLHVLINALEHNSAKVRKTAAKLLKNIDKIQVKAALKKYKFWTTFEKYYEMPSNYSTTFANRKVIEFDPVIGISDTVDTAYALRVVPGEDYYTKSVLNSVDKLQIILQSPLASNIEALVFGYWYTRSLKDYTFRPVLDELLGASEKFTNLKALFIGDASRFELQNISFVYCNLSYILLAYPQLETLKVRNNCYRYSSYSNYEVGLEFSPIRHEKLQTLIIEGVGISNEVFEEICKLELPALEYLELWFGRDRYINHNSINEFISVFYDNFPKLKYLGLRYYDHDYPDNVAFAIANSPICENLVELDLSMGKIGDEGAKALLKCSAIHQLDTLNISDNCLNNKMVEKISKLDIEVIADKQNPQRYYSSYG